MLWENTFRSCVLEQCCQSWNVLRECIFLQKCAEILIFLSSLWDQLRQMVYLWDLNTAWRDQSRCSSQLPALSQELKGLCVNAPLWDLPAHTRASCCGLRTENRFWPFQCFPWRTCGISRKLHPRWAAGSVLQGEPRGALVAVCFYGLSPQWDSTRQRGSKVCM